MEHTGRWHNEKPAYSGNLEIECRRGIVVLIGFRKSNIMNTEDPTVVCSTVNEYGIHENSYKYG